MGFSRQESWSGLPFPSPGDLPDPGTEPGSAALRADALPSGKPSVKNPRGAKKPQELVLRGGGGGGADKKASQGTGWASDLAGKDEC